MEEKIFGQETPDEMKLPAKNSSVPVLLQFVTRHAQEVGLGEARASEIAAAIEEALLNIINFAGGGDEGEIEIKCSTFGEDKFLIDIIDSCRPFNMLAATSFPETEDFAKHSGEHSLSTRKLKKVIKNIEYRRDFKKNQNILGLIVTK